VPTLINGISVSHLVSSVVLNLESTLLALWCELDPDSYGQVNTLQQLVAERALADLVLDGGERVLDVGCGDGKVTAMIVARLTTGTVVGVDPSAKMIDAARRLLPDTSRSTFMVGTAATLTFHASFDVATSFNALHWEIRWLEALRRIRSALRPNGRALLVFVCDGERPSLEDVVMHTCQSLRWQSAFDAFGAPFRARRPGCLRCRRRLRRLCCGTTGSRRS
jgi:trans-aconitate 2-methyltransferase